MTACNKQPGPDHPMHGSGVACHMHADHEGGCTWALEPSPARRGIDRLLAAMPFREIESIDSQPAKNVLAYPVDERGRPAGDAETLATMPGGPWVLLKFVGDLHPHAIWKHTGDVYQLGLDGTVDEDPIIRGDD